MKPIRHTVILALALAGISLQAADTPTPAPAEPKKSLWEHSVALGLTITKGNSDTVTATANWLSLKKWDKNEFRMGATGTYGENDGEKNASSAAAFLQYNRLFSERMFGYVRAGAYRDDIAGLEFRFVVSPGAGYYFIKNDKTQLSAEVGPGWVYEIEDENHQQITDTNTVPPTVTTIAGGSSYENYVTLRMAQRFEHKFSDRVRVWEGIEYLPQVDDWGNYIVNFTVGVESAMSKHLSLQVFILDTYTSEPAEGRDENDFKLVAAVAYKF